MGKPKLRSSIEILHEALTSFTPLVAGPFFVQPAKTHSSSARLTSFNSYDTPPSSAASSEAQSHNHNHLSLQCHEVVEQEEAATISSATSSTGNCSSCVTPSILVSDGSACDIPADTEAIPSGTINSKRFFFSPSSSKSITVQAEHDVGFNEMAHLRCQSRPGAAETGEDDDEMGFGTLAETETEAVQSTTGESSAVWRDSIPMTMASRDPYGDFRSSMEEMVMADELWDWPSLKELLHCYLCLNEKNIHETIVLAFLDLLMHLGLAFTRAHETM